MHILGVVGPEQEARAVADRLADRLGEEGRVAEVRRTETRAEAHDGPAAETYELADDGWTASGRERSARERGRSHTDRSPSGERGASRERRRDCRVSDLLDDLAPDHDYALLVGFPNATVPSVVVGDSDADPAGETLLEAETAADVDSAEVRARLDATEPYESLESLVAEAKRSDDAPYSGAIATFTGRVRAKEDPDDEPTRFLEFEKYEGVAEERMDAISAELEERDGVYEVVMHHRTGVIEYGEDIVFVVVLAGHREEAFRTVEDGINRLKDEVPIFKKEVTTDEQFWVHEQS
jgi:molybdopterin synthase catalytic subunit